MYPRQIEDIATQHMHALRAQRSGHHRAAGRPQGRPRDRGIRAQTGWTLVSLGLRLASPAGR